MFTKKNKKKKKWKQIGFDFFPPDRFSSGDHVVELLSIDQQISIPLFSRIAYFVSALQLLPQ